MSDTGAKRRRNGKAPAQSFVSLTPKISKHCSVMDRKESMKSKPDDGRDTLAAHIDAEAKDPLMESTHKKKTKRSRKEAKVKRTPPV